MVLLVCNFATAIYLVQSPGVGFLGLVALGGLLPIYGVD